jgi:hypothetical protein
MPAEKTNQEKSMAVLTTKRSVTRSRGRSHQVVLEALEGRQMFSLLGVMPGLPVTSVFGPPGSLTYSATTHSFDAVGVPVSLLLSLSPFQQVPVNSPSSFDLHISVSNAGVAGSGALANDLVITGSVDVNGDSVPDFTGTLLTGKVFAMGSQDAGTSDVFDFQFTVTGGSMASTYFNNKSIGMVMTTEGSTFNGSFASDFSATTKGILGPIAQVGGPPPTTGTSATIGFWQNKNGHAVILSSPGTSLSTWLSSTFPNLFGNLAGATNEQVYQQFLTYFDVKGPHTNAQVMDTALAIYFSDPSMGLNSTSMKFGFASSVANIQINVGSDGAAFGVPNGTSISVFQMLKTVDAHTVNGVIYGGSGTLWLQVNDLFDKVNEMFDIP